MIIYTELMDAAQKLEEVGHIAITDPRLLPVCDGYYTEWEDEDPEAGRLGIPVYHEIPPLHPVEVSCPQQVQAFREMLGRMMRIHLSKNQDYSPANISGLGEYGVAVRGWDKICRILNLLGFKIDAQFLGMDPPKDPNHEAVDDTWLDLATYSVIGRLEREGKWGH
jgi:hypothetical protein